MAKDKAGLLIALGGLKKPKGSEPAEGDEMDEEMPGADELESTAAADAFAAVKADDQEGFHDALKRFVKACMSQEEAGEY